MRGNNAKYRIKLKKQNYNILPVEILSNFFIRKKKHYTPKTKTGFYEKSSQNKEARRLNIC